MVKVEFRAYGRSTYAVDVHTCSTARATCTPRLHWAIVLVLSMITLGFFGMIWLFVQANWVKKVTGRTKPFGWTLAYMLYIPGSFLLGILAAIIGLLLGHRPEDYVDVLKIFVRLCGIVLYLFAVYTLKAALEEQPIGIPLSGVMTFFFSTTYFQYHLRDYGRETIDGSPRDSGLSGLGLSGPVAPIMRESDTSSAETNPS